MIVLKNKEQKLETVTKLLSFFGVTLIQSPLPFSFAGKAILLECLTKNPPIIYGVKVNFRVIIHS